MNGNFYFLFFFIFSFIGFGQEYDKIPPALAYQKYLKEGIDLDVDDQLKKISIEQESLDTQSSLSINYSLWKVWYFIKKRDFEAIENVLINLQNYPKNDYQEAVFSYQEYLLQIHKTKLINFKKLDILEQKVDLLSEDKVYIKGLVYDRIGRSHLDYDHFEQAIEYLKKAEKLFKKENYNRNLAKVYSILGICYNNNENFDLAVAYYQKALKLENKFPSKSYADIAILNYNLGLLYKDQLGNFEKAIFYYKKAEEYDLKDKPTNNPYLSSDYIGISSAYLDAKKLKQARHYANKALLNAQQNPLYNRYNEITSHQQVAEIHNFEKQYDSALVHLERAEKIINSNKKNDLGRWKAIVILKKVRVLLNTGDYILAKQILLDNEKLIKRANRSIYELLFWDLNFEISLQEKNYERAHQHISAINQLLETDFLNATYYQHKYQLAYLKLLVAENNNKSLQVGEKLLSKLENDIIINEHWFQTYAQIFSYKIKNRITVNDSILKKENNRLISFIIDNNQKNFFLEDNQYFVEFSKPIVSSFLDALYNNYQTTKEEKWAFSALHLLDTYKNAALMQNFSDAYATSKDTLSILNMRLNEVENQRNSLNRSSLENKEKLQVLYREEAKLLNQISKEQVKNNFNLNKQFFKGEDELINVQENFSEKIQFI